MIKKYEKACKESGMSEEKIREIRKIFDRDYKNLKYENCSMEKYEYSCCSLYLENEDGDYVFDIPDPTCNVEDIALHNLEMEKLMKLLGTIGKENRELILAAFDKDIKLKDYAAEHGMEKWEAEVQVEKILIYLKNFMV